MSSIVKFTSTAVVAAACPGLSAAPDSVKAFLGASRRSELPGLVASGHVGSHLRVSGITGLAMRGRVERPTQAPAVAVAQAQAYAAAAKGAGTPTMWNDSGLPFAGNANAETKKQQTTRAFRGLQPWRDPA